MATAPYFPFPSAATYLPPIFPGGYSYPSPFPAPASGYFSTAPGVSTFVHPHPPPPPTFPYAAAYPYPPPAPASPPSPTSAFPHPPNLGSTVSTPASMAAAAPAWPLYSGPPSSPWPDPAPLYPTSTPTPAPPPTGVPGSTPSSTQRWVASSPSPELDSRRIFIPTTASVSKRQPAAAPLLELHDPDGACSTPKPECSDSDHLLAQAAPQHTTAPSTSSSGRLPDSPGTTSAPAAALIVLCSGPGPERRPSSPSSAPVLAPSATQARRPTPPTIPSAEAQGQAEALVSKNLPRAVLDLKRRLDEHEAQTKRSFVSLQGQLSKLTDMFSSLTNSMVLSSTSSTTTAPTPSSGSTTMAASAPSLFGVAASSPLFSNATVSSSITSATTTAPLLGGTSTLNSTSPVLSSAPSMSTSTAAYVTPQLFGEMPQSYGFSNLHRQSILLADGTERSYYALPENYPLELVTPPMSPIVGIGYVTTPSGAAQVASLTPILCPKVNITAGSESLLVPNLQRPMHVHCHDDRPNHIISTNSPETVQLNFEQEDILISGVGSTVVNPEAIEIVAQPSHCINHATLRLLWDPGTTKFPILFHTAAGATKMQGTYVSKSAMLHILAVQLGARRAPIFKYAIMHSDAFGLGWTELNASAVFVLVAPCSKGRSVAKHSTLLSNGGTSMTIHYFPNLLMQLLCAATTVQVTEQMHPLEFSLMDEMLQNGSELRDGQLAYMPQGTSNNYADWVKHKVQYCCLQMVLSCPFSVPVCYGSKCSSALTIISAIYTSTASTWDTDICEAYPILPCTWDPGIDLFSYNELHPFIWIPLSAIPLLQQLHHKKVSYIWEFSLEKGRQVQWDPGIELLLCEHWWLQTSSERTEYALPHLLAVKFGIQNSTYFIDTAASMCCPHAYLFRQGRGVAAMLHFWRSIGNAMHYCKIFQRCTAMSSLFHYHGISLWLIHFQPP